MKKKASLLLFGASFLSSCTAAVPSPPPISSYFNPIIAEATALHQFEMALAAIQQAPTVVMQPMPVVVAPNPPASPPPVTVTPVIPPVTVPPVTGTGVPTFPTSPPVTPSVRHRKSSSAIIHKPHQFSLSSFTPTSLMRKVFLSGEGFDQ